MRQAVTEAHLLGRVHATARTINLSAMPLGALAGGLAAQALSGALGARAGLTTALTGCAAVAAMSVTQLLRRQIRGLRDYPVSPLKEYTSPDDAATPRRQGR